MNGFTAISASFPLTDALLVTLIGLVVVFAVLALLILCIQVLHLIMKDRRPAKQEAPAPQKEERISAGVWATLPEEGKEAEDPAFLACISACIKAYTGQDNFVIKSIKKG